MNKKYTGTKGLSIITAFERIKELMDKQPLGSQDEQFYTEAKELMDNELKDVLEKAGAFDIVEDYLTPTQWKKIFYKERKGKK